MDAAFAHLRRDDRVPTTPCAVTAFPHDASPYGVLGLGGNTRDWCADAAVRGGSWRLPAEAARCAARGTLPPAAGYPDVGFRLARSLDV
jgi:formylglycine-generating enzyme required for sulfatase activity